ncbi:MAG: hypothetical protein F4Y69_08215 [Chloroflexi bacterium]|nr:hypothetical protein [Chloroflexota bacterium]MYF21681.1 hypothetical protein [Chloroflexota bacterium]
MSQMKLGVARTLLRKHAQEIKYREVPGADAIGAACLQLAGYSSNQLILFGRRYFWVLEEADEELARLESDENYRDSEGLAALRRLVDYHEGYREVAEGGRTPCDCLPNSSGNHPPAEFDVWTASYWCSICDHFRAEGNMEGGFGDGSAFRVDEAREARIDEMREDFRDRYEARIDEASKPKKGLLRRLIGF